MIQQNRRTQEARFSGHRITRRFTNHDHCFRIQKQLNEAASGVKSK